MHGPARPAPDRAMSIPQAGARRGAARCRHRAAARRGRRRGRDRSPPGAARRRLRPVAGDAGRRGATDWAVGRRGHVRGLRPRRGVRCAQAPGVPITEARARTIRGAAVKQRQRRAARACSPSGPAGIGSDNMDLHRRVRGGAFTRGRRGAGASGAPWALGYASAIAWKRSRSRRALAPMEERAVEAPLTDVQRTVVGRAAGHASVTSCASPRTPSRATPPRARSAPPSSRPRSP